MEFVGHPLVDLVPPPVPEALHSARHVLGLLPGSRRSEVCTLLPIMLEAGRLLHRRIPDLECILPLASGLDRQTVECHLGQTGFPVRVIEDDFYRALGECRAALVASGTATLEAALLGVPLAVAYKLSPWTYRLARRFSGLQQVGLPNLVLGREAVPECIQNECRPDRLAQAIEPLLLSSPRRAEVLADLSEVRHRLGEGGAFERAARAVVGVLEARTS